MNHRGLSRRVLLRATATGAIGLAASSVIRQMESARAGEPGAKLSDPLAGEALYRQVVDYTALGHHRTGTPADAATASWLRTHLEAAGYQVELQSFEVLQSLVDQTTLLAGWDGRETVEAFPLWPAVFTAEPIIRPLVELRNNEQGNANGNVVLTRLPFERGATITRNVIQIVRSAIEQGAAAVLLVTEGSSGELTALNAPDDIPSWSVPVLLVGQRDVPSLQAAVRAHANVTIEIKGITRDRALANNVIGRLERNPEAPWVVLSTPYSGWFGCGGERGPGIAVWRGLAAWNAARKDTAANYLFVATSGHELGGAGMAAFLKEKAPKPDGVRAWLHLGAWAASYVWEPTQGAPKATRTSKPNARYLVATQDEIKGPAAVLAALPQMKSSNGVPIGEVTLLWPAGYKNAIGIAGGNLPHHTPSDGPENTGAELLEPIARAAAEFLVHVEALPHA